MKIDPSGVSMGGASIKMNAGGAASGGSGQKVQVPEMPSAHRRPMSGYEETISAPLRTGWIYVFFRGRLWRELSVVTSDGAAPVLRDTAVAQARTASKAFLESQPSLHGDWKRLDEMPATRARDSAMESDATFPGHWLHDVDGAKSQKAKTRL